MGVFYLCGLWKLFNIIVGLTLLQWQMSTWWIGRSSQMEGNSHCPLLRVEYSKPTGLALRVLSVTFSLNRWKSNCSLVIWFLDHKFVLIQSDYGCRAHVNILKFVMLLEQHSKTQKYFNILKICKSSHLRGRKQSIFLHLCLALTFKATLGRQWLSW